MNNENKRCHLDMIQSIISRMGNNAFALNSLPTPFARFFVAREAFRLASYKLPIKTKILVD